MFISDQKTIDERSTDLFLRNNGLKSLICSYRIRRDCYIAYWGTRAK